MFCKMYVVLQNTCRMVNLFKNQREATFSPFLLTPFILRLTAAGLNDRKQPGAQRRFPATNSVGTVWPKQSWSVKESEEAMLETKEHP